MAPVRRRPNYNSLQVPCSKPGCQWWFKTKAGRTKHHHSIHPDLPPAVPQAHDCRSEEPNQPLPHTLTPVPHQNEPGSQGFSPLPNSPARSHSDSQGSPQVQAEFHGCGDRLYRNYHPLLDGRPCNEFGEFLPPGTPPPPYVDGPCDDWTPYRNQIEFELAEFLFKWNQMSAGQINTLLDLWAATLLQHGEQPPFVDHHDLYKVIDSTPLGGVSWKSFTVSYDGEKPEHDVPQWMNDTFDVWYWDPHEVAKNMLGNVDYKNEMDYVPFPVAPYAGLRCFPQGRGFKQWTGNNSKALMKVYLPAIKGHVPTEVVRAFHAFLEFCYLVWRNVITERTLIQIQDALDCFHQYRTIFSTLSVVLTFSFPRQHAMTHYILLIQLFGALNGLCSSITEAKHIKVVKEPWRYSSHFRALGQMLLTNQRLDKLSAARADFCRCGMLDGTCLLNVNAGHGDPPEGGANDDIRADVHPEEDNEDIEVDDGLISVLAHVELSKTPQYKQARIVGDLAVELSIPQLPMLLCCFLFEQLHPDDECDINEILPNVLPRFNGKIWRHWRDVSGAYTSMSMLEK
ncbi:hypothetical protein BDN67DRAFT_985332 [Paxillus ammoniavirescens]|nr:hypothetical protein BDN67DRAFT_985332 [Paxillus ammoniavirescens]